MYFIYNSIYVTATCFDLVGHPEALYENRYKSCFVFLHVESYNAGNLNTLGSVFLEGLRMND